MKPEEIKKAIDFCNEEIARLELAPVINGCEMKKEWQEQIDIYKTILSAFDLINQYEAEIERLEDAKVMERLLPTLKKEIRDKAIKEFAKFSIDKSKNGIINICDLPDYVKEMGVE